MSEPMTESLSDPFADLGLSRAFEVDDTTLRAASNRTGNTAAYQAIADPRQRAQTLLMLMGGPTRDQWRGVPPDFAGALAAAGTDVQSLTALGQQRLNNIMYLFRQLGSNDKETVLAGRRRMVRAELNALDQLDAMLPTNS